MDQIQLQASKLWDLLFSEDTSETYQNALNLTGSILKESAQLIWLVICSVFVFGAWFGDASMKTGNSLRGWIEEQQNPSLAPAEEKPDLAETGKNLLATGRSSFDNFLNTAREQLGLEPVEPAPVKTPSVKKVAAAPATPAPEKAAPAVESPKASAPFSPPAKSAPPQSAASAEMPPASEVTSEVTTDVEEISREPDSGDWPPQDID